MALTAEVDQGRSTGPGRIRRPVWPELLLVGIPLIVAVAHALAVAPTYHVGSFDDDASYLITARALAHGTGLTGLLPAGRPLVGTYPPGFPLLLTPAVELVNGSLWAFRAVSLVFLVALFPLVGLWLARLGLSRRSRAAVLLLLALSPVVATYGTMVMAELPFMVVAVAVVLLANRWVCQPRAITATGLLTVVLSAALLWLKEAGVGLVIGLGLWLLVRRRPGRAGLCLGGAAALFAPVLVARAVVGTPLAGARYSSEIGGSVGHGLSALHQVGLSIGEYLGLALPRTVAPLPGVAGGAVFWPVYALIPVGVVVGAAVWARRPADAATVMSLVYFAETLVYPYINERRVVLVLPVVLVWLVTGAQRCWRLLASRWHRLDLRPAGRWAGAFGVALLVVPLLAQWGRNYRFAPGQDTSRPLGSSYMKVLAAVTPAAGVVETPYVWSTSLAAGRRTDNGIFTAGSCDPAALHHAAARDGAGFALDAALNQPPPVADCVNPVLRRAAWSVLLFHTSADDAYVYELIGPGTAHPRLRDLAGSASSAVPGQGPVPVWSAPQPAAVARVTVGRVRLSSGRLAGVRIQRRDPEGVWRSLPTHVVVTGGGAGFVVATPAHPVAATAVRLVAPSGASATVENAHVLAVTR